MKKKIFTAPAVLIFAAFFISANITFARNTNDSTGSKVEWEMKQYFFVFLNAVPERPQIDSAKAMDIQMGHLANIQKMFDEGKCRLAGPFLDNGDTRGILIMDAASEDEVRELLKNDPAITNGRLTAVIRPWYGPAGLYAEPKTRK